MWGNKLPGKVLLIAMKKVSIVIWLLGSIMWRGMNESSLCNYFEVVQWDRESVWSRNEREREDCFLPHRLTQLDLIFFFNIHSFWLTDWLLSNTRNEDTVNLIITMIILNCKQQTIEFDLFSLFSVIIHTLLVSISFIVWKLTA